MMGRTEIRLATDADLPRLEEWLIAEDKATDEGFYANWRTIVACHEQGLLTILVLGSDPIALLAEEDSGPLIMVVRPDQRGMGFGRCLGRHMIRRWHDRNASVLEIECAPSSSFGFWRRLGFQRFPQDDDRRGENFATHAYLILERQFSLGSGARVPYEIILDSADGHWDETAAPKLTLLGEGEVLQDGSVQLPERAVLYYPPCNGLFHRSFVHIRVGEKDVFGGELRDEKEKAAGVCQSMPAFHIDRIYVSSKRGSSTGTVSAKTSEQ